MRPNLLATLVLVLSSSASLPAFAQETNCAADGWFCSTNETVTVEQDAAEALPAPVDVQQDVAPSKAPPVVIIIIDPNAQAAQPAPRRSAPAPKARPVVRKSPGKQPAATSKTTDGWKQTPGFEFRFQRMGFMMDPVRSNVPSAPSMIGGGAGLRVPFRGNLELDVQNEMFYGMDFNGFNRTEVGLSTHIVRHINPTSPLRLYTIVGGYLGMGNVDSKKADPLLPVRAEDGCHYSTFGLLGGQAGVGAELRIAPFLSVRTDAQFALRWRFAATEDVPEYFEPGSGQAINTYPGFMLRAGVTIW